MFEEAQSVCVQMYQQQADVYRCAWKRKSGFKVHHLGWEGARKGIPLEEVAHIYKQV